MVNGAGACAEEWLEVPLLGKTKAPEICRTRYERDGENRILRQTDHDANGREISELLYTESPGTAKFNERGYDQIRTQSGVSYLSSKYDKDGHETAREYRDNQGTALPGPDRCYREEHTLDTLGLPIEKPCLNAEGQPMRDASGVAVEKITYDRHGGIAKIE